MSDKKPVQCPYCQLNAEVQYDLFIHVCEGCERTVRALPMLTIKPKRKSKP